MRTPRLSRPVRAVVLLAGLAALAFGLASCGHAVPQATPSPTASPAGDLPPAWVQKEVAWQSLAAGDAHPQGCSWTVTRAPRLTFLAPFLRSYGGGSANAVYFVVLRGHFHSAETPGQSGERMYLVLRKQGHSYLAHGLLPGRIPVEQLPRMRSYRPVVPVSPSLWGHTLGEGGPAPGGPYQARNTPVTVYAGRKASGSPLTTVRSDADGFFSLDLEPGTYTFIMTGRPYTATTATVRGEGPPLAVAVVLQMM